jgi:hypothetical protein
MFPAPHSPAGRVLSQLVSQDVPGTSLEMTRQTLARGARMEVDDAARALQQLESDGFVLVEASGDNLTVTVLLAPPLEDYGVRADWGRNVARADATPMTSTPSTDASVAEAPPATSQSVEPASQRRGPGRPFGRAKAAAPGADGTSAGSGLSATPGTPAPIGAPMATSETLATAPTPDAVRPAEAPAAPGVNASPAAAASSAPPAALGAAEASVAPSANRQGRRPAARGAGTPPAVDETAVLRGFVERFEQLLSELEEWKGRALQAEERVAGAERLLRSAERRAETAEEKLAAAQERTQAWSELTRRMQELARKAEGSGKARGASRRTPSPA